jgi:hypothetical protein
MSAVSLTLLRVAGGLFCRAAAHHPIQHFGFQLCQTRRSSSPWPGQIDLQIQSYLAFLYQ